MLGRIGCVSCCDVFVFRFWQIATVGAMICVLVWRGRLAKGLDFGLWFLNPAQGSIYVPD